MRSLRQLGVASAVWTVLLIALILAASAPGYAQSCALCYTQAASASHRMIQGLRTGILVLIVPPMFMSVGIAVLAYRKRNRTNDKPESRNSGNDW